MESKLDNVLLLERRRLLRLDRGCGLLVSSTNTRKAQTLITFILLGICVSAFWISPGAGLLLSFVTCAVLYPLVVTVRWELNRHDIKREVRFLDFVVQSKSIPTEELKKGHRVSVRTNYATLWAVEYQTVDAVLSFKDLTDEKAAGELLDFLDELRDWAVPPERREEPAKFE